MNIYIYVRRPNRTPSGCDLAPGIVQMGGTVGY